MDTREARDKFLEMENAFRKIYPEEYYRKFLEQNIRPDGRGLAGVRKTVITLGSLQNADGSAFVKIGSTTCVCMSLWRYHFHSLILQVV
jgi:exosome complex component RRP43